MKFHYQGCQKNIDNGKNMAKKFWIKQENMDRNVNKSTKNKSTKKENMRIKFNQNLSKNI